jgi:hypothetical protein
MKINRREAIVTLGASTFALPMIPNVQANETKFPKEDPEFEIEVYEWARWLNENKLWYVTGHYKDELNAYKSAEKDWEALQHEGFEINWKREKEEQEKREKHLKKVSFNLDTSDDYFRWNAVDAHWHLHRDKTWKKYPDHLMSDTKTLAMSEFPTREAALKCLSKSKQLPSYNEIYGISYEDQLKLVDPPCSTTLWNPEYRLDMRRIYEEYNYSYKFDNLEELMYKVERLKIASDLNPGRIRFCENKNEFENEQKYEWKILIRDRFNEYSGDLFVPI